ncbi:MAG TPA: lamin tail domain-containing protein [Polyangia bacterium]|nr:lamin tail domain-containing protein [Polyangia bacterium]
MPRAFIVVLSALVGAAACTPATDLTSGGPGGGTGSATAGTLVDPAAGAADVPVNLMGVTVRFGAAVTLPAQALQVCGATAAGVAPAACDDGVCYTATLGAALPAHTSCRVQLGAGALDGAGKPLPAGLIGAFDTSAVADTTPPTISGVTIAAEGPCLAVTFATDEAATGTIVLAAGDLQIPSPAGTGQTTFDVAVPLSTLPPTTPATVVVRAVDRAGNTAESAPVAWQTPAAVPPLAITEVLANPAGPEPQQEFVELRNLGADPLATDGLSIADGKGSDLLPSAMLGPGEYALVVASTYDPSGGADVPPRAGTQLLRVDTRIGADGLSNGGEVTRLLHGDAVVSSYGGWVDVSAAAWSGHSVHRLVESACDRSAAWNHTPLPATPGAGPP